MIKEQITFDDFDKVDIRIGTVISVKKNEKAIYYRRVFKKNAKRRSPFRTPFCDNYAVKI